MSRQNRRQFLRSLGAAAVSAQAWSILPGCAASTGAGAGTGKRPNVVLVITDDQGYGDLGCHGNSIIKTPNLDRLYAESLRLTDFHVGPTCSPTRAALMTGRYCNRTGVWHTIMGRSLLRKDEMTMADAFGANGYRTGIFGKWHLGDNFPFRPSDRGFQEALVHRGGGVGQGPDYWGNDYSDDTYFHNGVARKYQGYCTDIWFDGAMRFIENNRNRPFFVYLTTNAPHGPYNVPERYSEMYEGQDVPNANFYGMITNIDENMGRLTRQLRELDLEDDTILIFMTDNGTAAGFRGGKGFNARMRGTKGSEYDGGHRVPCFVRWPAGGMTGGRDVNRLTAHIDLLPTLIGLCELKPPRSIRFDGADITPLLRGRDEAFGERIIVTDSQRIEHPQKWRKSAVMTDRWRLVNGKELYDIEEDPGQRKDIADRHPETVNKLRDAYERWWEDVSERFDEYCRIVLGSSHENPTRLMSHDWHGPRVPWSQHAVRNGAEGNGFWAVDVARDGRYELELRRWPKEVDAPITDAVDGGKAIDAATARIKIGGIELSKPIEANARGVLFQTHLKAGPARLQTWFSDDAGNSRGAYYVYVKRLG